MAADETLIRRVMPHSPEAEQSVIGAMIIDQDAIGTAMEVVTGEEFYLKQYGMLFEAMVWLYNERKPVDLVTLQNRLREMAVPPEVSSLEYIGSLINAVPTSINVRAYAEIVHEKAVLRNLIRVNEEITNSCYAGKESLENIMEETERQIFQVLMKRSTGEFTPIREVVMNTLERIEAASRSKGNVTGIASGFIDLDYKTSGFQKSDLILIAARPSMGKTAFALNVAGHIAINLKKSVLIFSLEMSKEQLMNRLFAMESRVDAQKLRNGSLNDTEWANLIEGAGTIGRSGLMIDDTPGISVGEVRSKCRKYKLEHGLDLVLIDYLQLMQGSSKRSESRQQEISEISRSLKEIARELNVPVIALSQLSRAVEQRPDHRPMLSDLRESGAIEQDADVVMFLYREAYYQKDNADPAKAEVIIAKQRNGPIGTVELIWMPQLTKFANMQMQQGQGSQSGQSGEE